MKNNGPLFFHLVILIFFCLISSCFAEEPVDENAMFSDTQTVIDNQNIVTASENTKDKKKNTFGISGELYSISQFNIVRRLSVEEEDRIENDELSSLGLANLFLEERFQNGFKAFADLECQYLAKKNDWEKSVRELFLDMHINNRIYFRLGKQVLQWGRCYFWNPTDLINSDKKTFEKKIGYRDGTYGLRVHQPFGTQWNWYAFVDTGNKFRQEDLAGAFKIETVINRTEMAVSIWDKKNRNTVYGYDFSTRVYDLDAAGEISFSQGGNNNRLEENNGVLSQERNCDRWVSQFSLDLGKAFDWNEQNDKISVTGEYFYNQSGYQENVFEDKGSYVYQTPLYPPGSLQPIIAGSKKTFFLMSNLYEMNYYGKNYAALFTSINHFYTSDYTLNFNWIENLNDHSGILSLGLDYQNLHDWYTNLILYSFLGPDNREYTFLNQSCLIELTLGIRF
jgi:hypothetical protein